jgi:hypothetical protein
MKANELRIGNYYYGDVLFPSEYNVITANDLVELDSDPLDDYYQPLPLTEEWLIKFGFESFHKRDFKKKGLFITTYFATPQTLVDDDFGNKRVLELKYVHQLQNLYFALTNEELTMK